MFAGDVFERICHRLGKRSDQLELFLECTASFEEWFTWEAYAACRLSGWNVQPHVPYAQVGLLGSRETADLLVIDPTSDDRVLVEIAFVHDWTTNRWVASLDLDTMNLSRPLTRGVMPLQIVIAASLSSHIEVNRQWRSWLEMTRIWGRSSPLTHSVELGPSGQALVRGWPLADVE